MFSGFNASDIVIFVISLVVSLAIHEAMHAYAAHMLGDRTALVEGRLTLNPLKHLDVYTSILLPLFLVLFHLPPFFIAKPVPFNARNIRYGEFGVAIVGIAGPFSNFALAIVASIIARMSGIAIGTEAFNIVSIFMLVNIGLFVFNMIPFPPLDGSRLLYAFAPDVVRDVMERIESAGFLVIVIFMLVFFPFLGSSIGAITTSIYTFLLG